MITRIPARTPHILSVHEVPETGNVEVTTQCPFCSTKHTVVCNADAFAKWDYKYGPFIQNLMPELSADQREYLITGVDDCFFTGEDN